MNSFQKKRLLRKVANHTYYPNKCITKRFFNSEQEALDTMKVLKATQKEYKKLRRAYKCHICGKWHLTSHQFKKIEHRELDNS